MTDHQPEAETPITCIIVSICTYVRVVRQRERGLKEHGNKRSVSIEARSKPEQRLPSLIRLPRFYIDRRGSRGVSCPQSPCKPAQPQAAPQLTFCQPHMKPERGPFKEDSHLCTGLLLRNLQQVTTIHYIFFGPFRLISRFRFHVFLGASQRSLPLRLHPAGDGVEDARVASRSSA